VFPMPDPIRCPYCVQDNHFRVMADAGDGHVFKCERCKHVVIPENIYFQCVCPKCRALNARPDRPQRLATQY
jgi:Zn finger protein HypA/HybF involved in hydrogenase expression